MDFNSTLITELGPFICGKTSWLEYQDRMDKFFDEYNVWSSERKKAICVSMIGAKTRAILKNLIRPQTLQDLEYETIVAKLESYFYPRLSQTQHRFKFNQRKQKKLENFFSYVATLYKLIQKCNYFDPEDRLKRQIMVGVRDEDLKKQFVDVDNLTLTRLFEIGLAYDDARSFKPPPHPRNHKARQNRESTCFRCKESILKKHITNECCPFEWAECVHCQIKGHLSVACKYKDLICNYCSKKGHIERICNRKVEDEKGPRIISVSVSIQVSERNDNEKVLSISNMRINTTEEEIRKYFAKYGEIKSLVMEVDSNSKKFIGIAKIIYKYGKSYKKALGGKQHIL